MRGRGLMMVGGLLLAASTGLAAEFPKILPGEWEMTSTSKMATMTNLPPEVAAAIAKQQAKPTAVRYCVTPEEAARGPAAALTKANCQITSSSFSGGRMAAETTCSQGKQQIHTRIAGTWSPTGYDMNGEMQMSGGEHPMAMTMHVAGKRVAAECSAATRQRPPALEGRPPAH